MPTWNQDCSRSERGMLSKIQCLIGAKSFFNCREWSCTQDSGRILILRIFCIADLEWWHGPSLSSVVLSSRQVPFITHLVLWCNQSSVEPCWGCSFEAAVIGPVVLLVIHTTNLFSVLCERLGSLAVDYTPCVVDMAHSMLCQIINRPAEAINWDAKSETFCYISVLASTF